LVSITADRGHSAIKAPSLFLALAELPRALVEAGSLPWAAPLLLQARKGDGHPVMLLPGFMASEFSMRALHRYLKKLGYDPYHWELGRNLGHKAVGEEGEKMIARLDEIHTKTGRKVSLIGWSLGGAFARMLSRRRPDLVRQVISLGSPITGSPKSTNAWRAYQYVTGQTMEDPKVKAQVVEGHDVPPVPSTAIYSRSDGIVAWQNSREPKAKTTDNIEVRGSHCGLGANRRFYGQLPTVWPCRRMVGSLLSGAARGLWSTLLRGINLSLTFSASLPLA
jgi:pimeloyl-ACP methyl ester carboxylesterase